MNLEFKIALIRRYGSQIRAVKPLRIEESRLSRIIQGHREPTAEERRRFVAALGADYFVSDGEQSEPRPAA